MELQLNTGFSIDALGYPLEVGATVYTFYDWGEIVENQKTDPNRRLQSFGAGTRMRLSASVSADIEWVRRVVRRPLGAQSNTPALNADAIYWRLTTRF
jgi:hemolysin activation/secretion protein